MRIVIVINVISKIMTVEDRINNQIKISKVHEMEHPVMLINNESFEDIKEYFKLGNDGRFTFAGIMVVVHPIVEPDTFYIVDSTDITTS